MNLLEAVDIQLSFSRVGNCLDNAPLESFGSSLKRALVHRFRYKTVLKPSIIPAFFTRHLITKVRQLSRAGCDLNFPSTFST